MEKLMSMTDFVIQESEKYTSGTTQQKIDDTIGCFLKILNYANFLKQPLTLGMFVPCDLEGNLIDQCREICACECGQVKSYREAKSRVLFEGFEFSHDNNYNSVVRQKTHSRIKVEIQFRKYEKDVRIIVNSDYIHDCGSVERLIGLQTKPILTESAKKQIGL